MSNQKTVAFKMGIRLYVGDRMLGPGKMELLAHIVRPVETASKVVAAKAGRR
jgi:hypothetical protein